MLLGVAATGCSEKPPANTLVWESVPNLPTHRASLSSVVALSSDHVIAIGYDRPEGLISNVPLAFLKLGTTWTYAALPPPSVEGSVQILDSAADDDGTVWACGRSADYEPEPSRLTPLIYRYLGGVWSERPLAGVGNVDGAVLNAIAAHGSGNELELRAVGSADYGASGIVLRYLAGGWTRDSLPSPQAGGEPWTLTAVGHAPNGKWYVAGAVSRGGGGLLYVDEGSGWRQLSILPGYSALQFTALGFDGEGTLWLGGNYFAGDSLQGVLLRSRSGTLSPVSIARKTAGHFQIYNIGFDPEGHGWVVGGRTGVLPFLAGSAGGAWTESVAQVEREAVGSLESGGSDLYAVQVVNGEYAVAVGYKEQLDYKGFFESEASVYQLVIKPVGEIDLVTGPRSSSVATPSYSRRRRPTASLRSSRF